MGNSKIKELKFDLDHKKKQLKLKESCLNNIINISVSEVDSQEKIRQITWQVINEKINQTELNYE